jgi:hypothetical protein
MKKEKKKCVSFKYINIMRITIVYSLFRCDSNLIARSLFSSYTFAFNNISFRTKITPFLFSVALYGKLIERVYVGSRVCAAHACNSK